MRRSRCCAGEGGVANRILARESDGFRVYRDREGPDSDVRFNVYPNEVGLWCDLRAWSSAVGSRSALRRGRRVFLWSARPKHYESSVIDHCAVVGQYKYSNACYSKPVARKTNGQKSCVKPAEASEQRARNATAASVAVSVEANQPGEVGLRIVPYIASDGHRAIQELPSFTCFATSRLFGSLVRSASNVGPDLA